jgi:hypothetical protein
MAEGPRNLKCLECQDFALLVKFLRKIGPRPTPALVLVMELAKGFEPPTS